MVFILLVFAFLSSASGHGGVLWPPIWQDGYGVPIDQIFDHYVSSKPGSTFWWIRSQPNVRDPINGRAYVNPKIWATDQAYTGGIGLEFAGAGPVTNDNNQNLKEADRCTGWCVNNRQPWAAPGRTPTIGGGCGVYGGNPNGCPAHNDTRAAGSNCPGGMRSFGSEARFVEFPKMITTEWELGSVQEIAWSAGTGRHMGGYTFRLCKLGPQGRPGITEECFASNVLEFATNFTMIAGGNGREDGTFEKFEQTDLNEGTYPVGSVWRPIGKVFPTPLSKYWHVLRKDTVRIPANLPEGDYVLGWRWDVENGNQVWVSCSSVRLVRASDNTGNEEDEGPVYTDEEYEELAAAF